MKSGPITPAPLLRPLVFAVASVLFAVAAHTSTDGELPLWWCVAVAVPAVAVAGIPLAALEQRFGALLAGLVGIQLALHALFVVAADRQPGAAGAAGWLCCGSSQPVTTGHTGALFSISAVMQLLAHLVAAVALAVVLRQRERAVWARVTYAVASMLASLLAVVRAVFGLLPPAPRPFPAPPSFTAAPKLRRDLVAARRIARRGPPALAPA